MTEENKSLNFVKDDVIYIHGFFDNTIQLNVLPDFKKLISDKEKLREAKITIDVCSFGGYAYILTELLGLIEVAKSKNIIIETRSMSLAYSCGAMLLIAGTKGHRYASKFTNVLFHHATHSQQTSTNKQLERMYEFSKNFDYLMEKHIENNTKIPKDILKEMLSDDLYYLSGEKLKKYGIIDSFITNGEK